MYHIESSHTEPTLCAQKDDSPQEVCNSSAGEQPWHALSDAIKQHPELKYTVIQTPVSFSQLSLSE